MDAIEPAKDPSWYLKFDMDKSPKLDSVLTENFDEIEKTSKKAKKIVKFQFWNKQFFNIILLGLGFCFTIGAFQVCMVAQTVVLNSIHDEYFDGTSTIGYFCLAINFAAMALSFVLSPALSVLIGPKSSMITGAIFLTLSIATLIRPLNATLYFGSVIQGMGCGIMWTVCGHFLTENSTEKNIGRNTGIFWVLFQIGPVSLNLFYFFITRGATMITAETRFLLFMVLLPISAMGIVMLALLDLHICHRHFQEPKEISSSIVVSEISSSGKIRLAMQALDDELKMALSKEMMLFIPMFVYMGVELTFFLNVFGTSLGYARQYGDLRESLVGLHGVFISVGQIFGGVVYGLLGGCLRRYGRDLGILLALLVHLGAFYLVYLILPERSAFEMTSAHSIIPPSPSLAMLCSFLLGFGDAGFNNPLFPLLGLLHPKNPVAAFALFQAYQSFGNVVALSYSSLLTIPYQLAICVVLSIVGAFGFFLVDWKNVYSEEEKSKSPFPDVIEIYAAHQPKHEIARHQQVTVL